MIANNVSTGVQNVTGTVYLSDNVITGNLKGTNGSMFSYGNNKIRTNGTDIMTALTIVGQN